MSAYGNDSDHNGLTGAVLTGMGSGTSQVQAQSGSAVMFVEITYEYQALFLGFLLDKLPIKQEAAMLIRDDRNLDPGLIGGNSKSTC